MEELQDQEAWPQISYSIWTSRMELEFGTLLALVKGLQGNDTGIL